MTGEMTFTVTITGPNVVALRRHKSTRDYLERAIQANVWALMRAVCGVPTDSSEIHVSIKSGAVGRVVYRWGRFALTKEVTG